MVEEGKPAVSRELVREIMDNSLTNQMSRRYGFDLSQLKELFYDGIQTIENRVADPGLLPTYSSTGLSAESCERIRTYVSENRRGFEDLAANASVNAKEDLIRLFLAGVSNLPEMTGTRDFSGNRAALLSRWIDGGQIAEMSREFRVQPQGLAKFVEESFSYLLPWGMSALTRIAAKSLELEGKPVSDYFLFFPTMVKFGVPTPAACWAMAVGMPTRDVGARVSAKYLSETGAPNHEDFLKWIGNISSETLEHEYKLKNPILEDASRAIFQSGSNPLLREFATVEDILPKETYVRGISYERREVLALSARVGQEVELLRDYDNPVDRNAIKVLLEGRTLGFIERQLAQLAAPDVDCGLKLKGRVVQIESGRVPQIKIVIDKA